MNSANCRSQKEMRQERKNTQSGAGSKMGWEAKCSDALLGPAGVRPPGLAPYSPTNATAVRTQTRLAALAVRVYLGLGLHQHHLSAVRVYLGLHLGAVVSRICPQGMIRPGCVRAS